MAQRDLATCNESRDPRFAELDAKIDAGEAARQQRPDVVRKPKRRRSGPRLPAVVRKEIARFARELRQQWRLFLADPKLKDRAARFLRSLLPPKCKRGRPGIDSVTKAIRLDVPAILSSSASLCQQLPNSKSPTCACLKSRTGMQKFMMKLAAHLLQLMPSSSEKIGTESAPVPRLWASQRHRVL